MQLTSSIAMCTYNGERFLQQQLDSLAKQTILPDELIVCDDGSTDATISILESFVTLAPFPVRFFRNEKKLGYGKNFEKAASKCTKDIILFSDQDDVWQPEKIEIILSEFQNRPDVGLILHGYEPIDAQGTKISNMDDCLIPDYTNVPDHKSAQPFLDTFASTWYGCMMAYRNQWQDILYPFVEVHDTFILNLLAVLTETLYLERPLIEHRLHENNTVDKRILKSKWGFWRFIPQLWASLQKRLKKRTIRPILNYDNWGAWRFIPRLWALFLRQFGLYKPRFYLTLLLRREIVQRLESVSKVAHPEYLRCYQNETNMQGFSLRKLRFKHGHSVSGQTHKEDK